MIFGTGVGGLHTLEEQIDVLLDEGRAAGVAVPRADDDGQRRRARRSRCATACAGPNETITTACAAGTHAIGYAARLIAWGHVRRRRHRRHRVGRHARPRIAGFGNMTALSTSGISRPFDVDRDGFVMGEGAAVLVLEEWEAAEARGATILGEVLGAASNADAHHITAPSPGGVGRDRLHAAGARRRRARARRHRPRSTPTARRPRSTTPPRPTAITEVFGAARPADHVDQGRHRPRARRRRRARGGRRAAVDASTG